MKQIWHNLNTKEKIKPVETAIKGGETSRLQNRLRGLERQKNKLKTPIIRGTLRRKI